MGSRAQFTTAVTAELWGRGPFNSSTAHRHSNLMGGSWTSILALVALLAGFAPLLQGCGSNSVTCHAEKNGATIDITMTCTDDSHYKMDMKVTANGQTHEQHTSSEVPKGSKCDQNALDQMKAHCKDLQASLDGGPQAFVVLTKRVNALMSSIPAKNEGDGQVGTVAVAAGAGAAGGVIAAAVLMVLKRRFTVHEPTLLG